MQKLSVSRAGSRETSHGGKKSVSLFNKHLLSTVQGTVSKESKDMAPALKLHGDRKQTGSCKAVGVRVLGAAQGAEGHCSFAGPPANSVQDHTQWPVPLPFMLYCSLLRTLTRAAYQ